MLIYSSSLCWPYTLWWTVCYLYNLLFLFLFSPLSSTIFLANLLYFCYIHLYNVMIRGPFWREDRVWSWNKLVWWAWWCQYIVYPSSILASPLHACDKDRLSRHLEKSYREESWRKKIKCEAVYFGLWLSSLLTRIRLRSPLHLCTVYPSRTSSPPPLVSAFPSPHSTETGKCIERKVMVLFPWLLLGWNDKIWVSTFTFAMSVHLSEE